MSESARGVMVIYTLKEIERRLKVEGGGLSKFNKYKSQYFVMLKTYCMVSVLLLGWLIITAEFFILAFLFFTVAVAFFHIREKNIVVYLYTFGKRSVATITHKRLADYTIKYGKLQGFIVSYSYIENEEVFFGLEKSALKSGVKEQSIKGVGDQVEIILNPEAPNISHLYSQEYANKYNLKG